MPTTVLDTLNRKEHPVTVMIGIDPHKGSHTAVAVDTSEHSLAELRVRSGPKQLDRLLGWAERFPERPCEPQQCQTGEAGQVHPDAEELGVGQKCRGELSGRVPLVDCRLDELAAKDPKRKEGDRGKPQPAHPIHAVSAPGHRASLT